MNPSTAEIDLAVALAANRARGIPQDGRWHVTPLEVPGVQWARGKPRHRAEQLSLRELLLRSLRRLVRHG